jgi:integrase
MSDTTYAKATLIRTKGKWYVQVTVPAELRGAFNGVKQKRLSTNTSDRREAERRLHDKAAEIYASFDVAAKTFDPLGDAARNVYELLDSSVPNSRYPASLWDPDDWKVSAEMLRARAYSIMDVEAPLGDYEEGAAIIDLQHEASSLLERFEEEMERRQALSDDDACKMTFDEVSTQLWEGLEYERSKTKAAYKKASDKFSHFAGNPRLSSVTRQQALEFVEEQSKRAAYNTLQRDVGAIRRVFGYAVDRGWIDKNPFESIQLKGRGKAPVSPLPYRRSQLEKLFALRMPVEHKLCLSILAATGMRLDEAALLRWEDVCQEGEIQYFDLQRVGKILKNSTAARQIPVSSHLSLPEAGTGRLFSFRLDQDGKAENAASKALMRHVKKVRDDPDDRRHNIHALRHTFKDLLRDADVPAEVQDFILGHRGGGQGSRYGSGPSLKTKASWMENLDLGFLRS